MLFVINLSCSVKTVFLFFVLLVLLISAVCEDCIVNPYANNNSPFLDTPSCNYRKIASMRSSLDCFSRYYIPALSRKYRKHVHRAFFGEVQHMAAIGWTRSENKIDYLCGGSLISEKFVLTAAQCNADQDNISPDTVRLGDTNLESAADDELAKQIAIKRFIIHPMYRGSRSDYDLAIIKLRRRVKFSRAVCSACLWREEQLPREKMEAIVVRTTGAGEAQRSGFLRLELSEHSESDSTGRIQNNSHHRPDGLRKNQFCAAETSLDTCEGSSVGPIGVKRLDANGWVYNVVVGIASFSTPWTLGSTGAYTTVSSAMDWIEQVTKKSFDYDECVSHQCEGQNKEHIPIAEISKLYISELLWNDADTASPRGCGPILIDDQYFLTFASCVTSSKGHPRFVGIKNYNESVYEHASKARVTDVYVSPKYRLGTPENNIALIRVAKFVNTERFPPYCLWNTNIDGVWEAPHFKAFGVNDYAVEGFPANRCDLPYTRAGDLVCFTNSINLMPGVCTMDYGGPVFNLQSDDWFATDESKRDNPLVVYGLVSALTKDCGSNLYMTDVTPHIDWIESIIVHKRDRFLVFSN